MHDRNFKRSIFAAIVMIIIESLLLFGKSYSQQAPSVDKNRAPVVISKVIGSTELQAAFKRCKSKSLLISFYPVRAAGASKENPWDFKVVYQCKDDKTASAQTVTKTFAEGATAYIKYLRKMQVPKENVPFCYYIEIKEEEAKNLLGIAVNLDVFKSDFQVATIFPCNPYSGAGNNTTDSCDCNAHPVYLAYSSIPPGKCPPNCPRLLQQSKLTSTVKKAVEAAYNKE